MFEGLFFASRPITVLLFTVLTGIAIWGMADIKFDSQFDKQLPQSHPYIKTFAHYGNDLTPADELAIALTQREGQSIYDPEYLQELAALEAAVRTLPYIHQETVTSILSPTVGEQVWGDDGLEIAPLVPQGRALAELTPDDLAAMQARAERGNLEGLLIGDNNNASLITVRVYSQLNGTGFANLNQAIEQDLRPRFERDGRQVLIVGFAKRIGAIAEHAQEVIQFIALSAIMTFLFVIYFARSIWLGMLATFCSSLAVTWQVGVLAMAGVTFDPLGVLIPFLLFAIGISHGLQQVNRLSRSVCSGHTPLEAARASFRQLMIPGSMALLTDLIGFGTLMLVPIPLIRDISIAAMTGLGFMILSNLVLLPIIGSYLPYSHAYRSRITRVRHKREQLLARLGWVAEPRYAFLVTLITMLVIGTSVWQSRDRQIGDDKHGAPELHAEDRYNQDATTIAALFSAGTDKLAIAVELPHGQCRTKAGLEKVERFRSKMATVEGVARADAVTTKLAAAQRAYWGMDMLPDDPADIARTIDAAGLGGQLLDPTCRMVPVALTLVDHADTTLSRVIDEVNQYQRHQPISAQAKSQIANATLRFCIDHVVLNSTLPGGQQIDNFCAHERVVIFINEFGNRQGRGSIDARPPHEPINQMCEWAEGRTNLEPLIKDIQIYCGTMDYARYRLAGGNAGIQAALNEEVERQEIRAFLIVYAVIILLVAVTYRDWRATICCTLPLTGATFSGYWFMSVMDIGLSVATLPVLVLAVGVGVDYAFYIYNRLQHHLSRGHDVVDAYRQSIAETGSAVIATALTLALGVIAWAWSDLQFQAEMGLLLCVMFVLNMVGAVTALPALAVVIDKLVPRRRAVRAPLAN